MNVLHPFEKSGLGTAPFRCVGHERRVVKIGDTIRASGTCDHCGTGIADCFVILSSDGKRFVVGSSCVAKTYREVDAKVPLDIRRAIAEVAREKRDAKTAAKWEVLRPRRDAAKATIESSPSMFTDRQHPIEYFAKQGATYRDYVLFNLSSAGLDGQAWACKTIEAESNHGAQ